MRPVRVFPAILFLANLALGIGLGVWFSPSQIDANTHPLPTLANQQRTILLIFVDHLQEDASLAGVWTLIYTPNYRVPTWIPVYPAPPSANREYANQLADSFQLTRDLQPVPAFLNLLSQHNLVWSGYIIADTSSLKATLEFLDLSLPEMAVRLTSISNPGQHQTTALYDQASILGSLCKTVLTQPDDFDLLQLYVHIRKYVHTDFNLYLTFTEWKEFFQPGKSLVCQFPTIEANRP